MIQSSDDEDITESPEDKKCRIGKVFDVLISPQRRTVLYVLCERSKIDMDELMDEIIASETTDEADCRERLAVALSHVHLPKLEQVGLITHDREADTVELNCIPRRFERYIRFTARDEGRECGS